MLRKIALLSLSLALFATSALPARAEQNGLVVSGFNCRQTMPCDLSNGMFPPIDLIMSVANSCVAHYMGKGNGMSAFLNTGLDTQYCLETNADAFPASDKASMRPFCCLKPAGQGQCVLSCAVVSM